MTNLEYIERVANSLINHLKYSIEFDMTNIEHLLLYISLNDLLNYKELTEEQRDEIKSVMLCIKRSINVPDSVEISTGNDAYLLLEDSSGINLE